MKIVLASNNPGKLAELQAMLAPLGLELLSQAALGIPEAEEPFRTFVENALATARHASALSGLPALADDAGLGERPPPRYDGSEQLTPAERNAASIART